MARAALALHEATGDATYLAAAERLANAAQTAFADGHGGFYSTAVDASDVPLTRPRTAADNATPAGNGMMAEVLARLFHLTGDPDWRTRTSAVLTAFAGQPDQLAGMPTLLAAADLLEEATSVVIAGAVRRRCWRPRWPRPTLRSSCCAPPTPARCRPITQRSARPPGSTRPSPMSAGATSAACRSPTPRRWPRRYAGPTRHCA